MGAEEWALGGTVRLPETRSSRVEGTFSQISDLLDFFIIAEAACIHCQKLGNTEKREETRTVMQS